MGNLKGKKILLGISGGIAAYKSALLVRLLIKEGAEVKVVMTPSAKEFITPLTLSTLSRNPVISEFFARADGSWHSHVDLGIWADAMVIAPATASTIGKMANGIADNMLITTYLSCKSPVFIAPAMDLDMYFHPSTQRNLATLRQYGNHIIEPASGFLASGLEGKGRMEEPEAIADCMVRFFTANRPLKGKRVLITAGPTYEKIDPIRFIGNYSSGKMGYALAEVCAEMGATVELVSGPTALSTVHPNIHCTNIESATQMHLTATTIFPSVDIAILSAAVADFRPTNIQEKKIKRGSDNWLLELEPNPDIARELGMMKQPHQRIAGFALETNDGVANAKGKLTRKNFDLIVLNSANEPGAGFQVDTNRITIICANGREINFETKPKREVALDIIKEILSYNQTEQQ